MEINERFLSLSPAELMFNQLIQSNIELQMGIMFGAIEKDGEQHQTYLHNMRELSKNLDMQLKHEDMIARLN
jgi:hypothetical protein